MSLIRIRGVYITYTYIQHISHLYTYILRIRDIYVAYKLFIRDRHTDRQRIAYVYDLVA